MSKSEKHWIFKAGNETNQIELWMRKLLCQLKSWKCTEESDFSCLRYLADISKNIVFFLSTEGQKDL